MLSPSCSFERYYQLLSYKVDAVTVFDVCSEGTLLQGYDVTAVDVNPGDKITSLRCEKAQVDVASPDSIAAFKKAYGDGPLDLLLNIAGVMAPHEQDALATVSHDTLLKTFGVNTFGPLLLTQALLPNLLKAGNARLGVVSSRVGSIADNRSGGSYAYRASKAAVNSVFKSVAVDLRGGGVVVVVMHPGIVRTGLAPGSSWASTEAVMPEEAAEKLYQVLLSKGLGETGRFWHREGFQLEW
ncbi:NAD(P)-binding protein [Hypoxylon sp. FL0543]|nr:NAD(P)-binding protein [Hypoxylon sp. FL0543]